MIVSAKSKVLQFYLLTKAIPAFFYPGVPQRSQDHPECDVEGQAADYQAFHPARQHHQRRGAGRCGRVRAAALQPDHWLPRARACVQVRLAIDNREHIP